MGDISEYYREHEEHRMWFEFEEQQKTKHLKWWVQKDGSKIHITKMTDSHINNCIALIDKDQWRLHWKEPLLNELKRREPNERSKV